MRLGRSIRGFIAALAIMGLVPAAAMAMGAGKSGRPQVRNTAASIAAPAVSTPINVAIYNDEINGPGSYFDGGDSNAWETLQTILDSDPQGRFTTTVVTDLSAETLSGFDVLVLPDNSVPDANVSDVTAWFTSCKIIVCLDSAVSFAEFSGLFWPGYGGDTEDVGDGTLWDYSSCWDDGQISAQDYITDGYTVGQSVSSQWGDAEFYPWTLPSDAVTFLVSAGCIDGEPAVTIETKGVRNVSAPRPNRAVVAENGVVEPMVYGVFRDIPNHGRMVLLGPYNDPDEEEVGDAWPMFRNACTIPYLNSFMDNYGASQVCLKACGNFTWNVMLGYGAPATYTGTLNVYNGGTMFWSQPGASQYVYVYYDPNNHMAWGYLYDYGTGVYSSLFDSNTLDDPPCLGSEIPY